MRFKGKLFRNSLFFLFMITLLVSCNNFNKLDELQVNVSFMESYRHRFFENSGYEEFYQFNDISAINSFFQDENKVLYYDDNFLNNVSNDFFASNSIILLIFTCSSTDVFNYATYDDKKSCINYHFTIKELSTDDLVIKYIFNVIPTVNEVEYKIERNKYNYV